MSKTKQMNNQHNKISRNYRHIIYLSTYYLHFAKNQQRIMIDIHMNSNSNNSNNCKTCL